ncbi:hypothetical protein [Nocardia sp. NPDC052566]|uniref:hypothetical protein n=1 Tax=Nocardia sp. NPDC052566 TaxID=3364330 RepID=UPI0037C8D251
MTPERVANAFRSYLRSDPGIDHILFTSIGRRLSRPYLEAHVVDGRVHVKVAPLHHADPHTRAIVHHLHATITDTFESICPTTILITPDIAGLNRWAQTVLANERGESTDAGIARSVLGLLRGDPTDAPGPTNEH